MRTRAHGVDFGIYLDDRTIWSTGPGATALRQAMNIGRAVDKAFGLEEHPGKRELVGNMQKQ